MVTAPARTGPYGQCTEVGTIAQETFVLYDCYVTNGYGNTWTWVRSEEGRSLGWVWDKNLQYGGAGERC
ncbi:hypothetical protein FHX34_105472 [Actinoplanes teichomyceticus]|uniref:SH3 domain-containing protein n=1 Tax=Actinoplanes teichomyceticus TaxID=1867 RepID=A0A561VLV9_ACTTI|nr:hypothetical protein FHX34_105472 [Actinoplanes teichomyceticus]GIF13974.1 hypothetical protein Ate01nite_40060 [Actinoplanes teichomyceticus]